MKDLQSAFNDTPATKTKPSTVNKGNLLKYLLMFIVVTVATLVIPTCGVLQSQAVMVGLLASTTFVIIDTVYPNHVYINEFHS